VTGAILEAGALSSGRPRTAGEPGFLEFRSFHTGLCLGRKRKVLGGTLGARGIVVHSCAQLSTEFGGQLTRKVDKNRSLTMIIRSYPHVHRVFHKRNYKFVFSGGSSCGSRLNLMTWGFCG